MLIRVFGGGAKQPLCSVKSAVGMHDLVVLLAVVPVHLFELVGGSIPSTTGGWDDLFLWWGGQRKNIFFPTGINSLANCNGNFGRLLVFLCLLVVTNFFPYWSAALDVWVGWLRFLAFGLHYGVQLYRNIIIGCLGFPVRLLGFQLFCLT